MWLDPVPVTDTTKAITEITKPHSNTKSRIRTGNSLLAVFPTSAVFIPLWVLPLVLTDEKLWCNCVFIHDSTQWEGLAANARGFVNKSSKLTEEKTSNNKRFFFPDGWVTIQREKKRPRFNAAERSGISFTSVKSQLTIELIDEDYPAEKEEALWRDSLGPSVWVVLYFHNRAFESRITSSLAQSPNQHQPTPADIAAAWIILSLAPVF